MEVVTSRLEPETYLRADVLIQEEPHDLRRGVEGCGLVALNQFSGIVQRGLDRLGRQGGIAFQDLGRGFSGFQEFQHLVNHDPRPGEAGLTVADVWIDSDRRIQWHGALSIAQGRRQSQYDDK